MVSNATKNAHLLWRAGFGPSASGLEAMQQMSSATLFNTLQKGSAAPPTFIDVADDFLKELFNGSGENGAAKKLLDKDVRQQAQQKQREGLRSLNLHWMQQMVQSEAQLREKMAFFWHGHFACRNNNVLYQQQLLHLLRQQALGNFRTLLYAVSKSAAMLQFLNAAQNRKGHPNENFAREVMELFTLGRGQYTENDIKEAARAFTGWSATANGEFFFRRLQHDGGTKTVFGKKGNFTGEEVLDMLLERKETARFITQKLYTFFVQEAVDGERIAWLANRFYNSDYNIAALMEDIFTANWFYDAKNVGRKIKAPVELLVGLQRMLPMDIQNKESILLLQRVLGQVLFYPPNVAGWPGGKAWIDSTTLMARMRLPQMLNDSDTLNITPKTDDDQMMGKMEAGAQSNALKNKIAYKGFGKGINATINWNAYTAHFQKVERQQLLASITSTLLQTSATFNKDFLKKYTDDSSRENFIKSVSLQLMSTPEYQLC